MPKTWRARALRAERALDKREDQFVALIRKHERMLRRYGWLQGANFLREEAKRFRGKRK